jgi:putative transposase
MLKGSSSHFINHTLKPPQFYFAWQRGYGYFSLGESQLPKAVAYVQNQKTHHAQNTVNAWLEKASELDEGPPFHSAPPPDSDLLREAPASYLDPFPDEIPF